MCFQSHHKWWTWKSISTVHWQYGDTLWAIINKAENVITLVYSLWLPLCFQSLSLFLGYAAVWIINWILHFLMPYNWIWIRCRLRDWPVTSVVFQDFALLKLWGRWMISIPLWYFVGCWQAPEHSKGPSILTPGRGGLLNHSCGGLVWAIGREFSVVFRNYRIAECTC